jgi:hypothetical protein
VASSLAMQLQVSVERYRGSRGHNALTGPLLVRAARPEKLTIPCLKSGVRKHPGDLVLIRLRHQNRTTEVALGLGSL